MKTLNSLLHGMLMLAVSSCFTMCKKAELPEPAPRNKNLTSLTVSADTTDESLMVRPVYTVQPSQWYVDGKDILPGTIVSIPAGTRGALLLKNFHGTEANPIVIVNKGGTVNITAAATASYGFKTQNCQYFKILGNGDASSKYGIAVTGGNIGMTMDALSTDFEIANVEVRNSGFAGIMAKTDPTCDQATWRGNFTMKNVVLHDNYVHNTGGEGFYVGNSFYANGVQTSCGKVMPHDVVGVKVYNNQVDSTGCEGIQVGSAIADCAIYNNVVNFPGLSPFASGQNNGIQLGEGTGGKCYSNIVRNAPGAGIIVLGLGDNTVANNVIINSGMYGIFADSRYTPGPYFRFVNNTIINSKTAGIRLNSTTIPMNVVANNAIVSSLNNNAISRMNTSVKLTSASNYIGADVSALEYTDLDGGDFTLLPSSPLIGAGTDVSVLGISLDLSGLQRITVSTSSTFNIGAVLGE
ncbi:right-handed parallel beta-helix repeat-containing protein [Mucilaginibacter terrenus]|uniref:Right-handed parallel beta-helix repeat-containing protein n=1 Tax=Mucilaginibacter terrenus TaxID=2482727 RepID=A0A3E2NTP1_9SPHI|nr:right-handed parallel beta-helix repeat-containing protein [Mucilaginibacter terrenus]RFZ84339.1 right-handed parallel beta-helix repeat-containing protein [Mucilaginibacter terrenus]